MMRRLAALVVAVCLTANHVAAAQEADGGYTERGPRFLVGPAVAPTRLDVSKTPALHRRISLDLRGLELADALRVVSSKGGVQLAFSDAVLPTRTVKFRADSITVAAALTELLLDARVDILFSRDGRAVLVRRQAGAVQGGSVAGRITDAKTGDGLASADVTLDGTRWRTTSGDNGAFKIADAEAGSYTLTVRRVGYAKQSKSIVVVAGSETTVDAALQPVATQLNELVTTVTGEQRRLELGHVVGVINADSLVREAPISSLTELLTARVPGLQVFTSSGSVGGEVHLQSRGPNSFLLNTEPILVVDGIRYSNRFERKSGGVGGPSVVEPTSPLNDINPNDIESIEIVKGPSAATLYGTDAANGVVVIRTKRGQPGAPRWNAYVKAAATAVPDQSFAESWYAFGRRISDNQPTRCVLQSLAAGSCVQDSVVALPNPLNDPKLTIFGSEPRWNYGTNVSGGRQDLRYYFSGDGESAVGPVRMPRILADQLAAKRGVSELPDEQVKPNALTKLNLRTNVTAVLGEATEVRVNAGYVRNSTRSLGIERQNPYSWGVFGATPTAPYSPDGAPEEVFSNTSTEKTDRFIGSAGGQWRPATWFLARATIGLDLAGRNRFSLVRRGDAPNGLSSRGAVNDNRVRQLATTGELNATATLRRNRLSSRSSVGVQYVRNVNDGLLSSGSDLPPGGTSVGEAAFVYSGQSYFETVTLGSYVEETVGFNDRLFVTGALRIDGASAFGQDYNATTYPKVSVSWLVSQEPFFPRLPGLDELRVRYAYGASGQQPQPSWSLPSYAVAPAFADGTTLTSIGVYAIGNPQLRPERIREQEGGFDATLAGNRVQLGLTWFKRRTVDQIMSIPLPPGLGSIYTNLGLTTQHGFEAELTAHVLDTRLASFDVMLQHGLHRTKLNDLGGATAFYSAQGGWVEGYPLGARFQRPVLGYTDTNGDGIIVGGEMQLGNDPLYVGESTPPVSQTATASLGFFDRRIRIAALFERRSGYTQVDDLKASLCSRSLRCRAANDPTVPGEDQGEAALVREGSFTFVDDGTFTRLRELSISFDVPARVAHALRVRSAAVSIAGRNLALWTDFGGPDPESAAVDGVIGGGAEGIPQGRTWSFRVDLGL